MSSIWSIVSQGLPDLGRGNARRQNLLDVLTAAEREALFLISPTARVSAKLCFRSFLVGRFYQPRYLLLAVSSARSDCLR